MTRASAVAVAVATVLLVAGCSDTSTPAQPEVVTTEAPAHEPTGVDAQEVSSPLTRLVLVDPQTGATVVYDATDETETLVGEFGPVDAVSGDGRFAYLVTGDGVTVVDAGAWTFDHGDHNHYYVLAPTVAGALDDQLTGMRGARDITAAHYPDGTVGVIDRDKLGDRDTDEAQRAEMVPLADSAGATAAAPLGNGLVVATAAGQIESMTTDGTERSVVGECAEATGAVPLSGAVVFGCGDGAVRLARRAGQVTATPMPFGNVRPAGQLGPLVRSYAGNRLAAVAGDDVWILDTREGTWATVAVPGVVAVNTAGGSLLALTGDGVLHSFDIPTGAPTATTQLFGGPLPADAPPPVIEADADRAYVNDAARQVVYEIDYADALRVSRELAVGVTPGYLVETGR